MQADIPLSKLKDDIHTALKSWHETNTDQSPLDYLQLFRQARLSGATNARRATNDIIWAALETLTAEHEDSANLLRQHFLDGLLMHAIANRLNIGQSTAYRKQQEALKQLALIVQTQEIQAREVYQSSLEKRLKLPAETELFGIEAKRKALLDHLLPQETPWLASIEGLGGIGKTALANSVVRSGELINRFQDVAWVSAKPRDFFPGIGLTGTDTPILTVETLIDSLLQQLGQIHVLAQPSEEKQQTLLRLLKQAPYLIIIDNLETVVDYQTLLPLLWGIANPSKVLLTSRYSLRAYPDIYCITLDALSRTDTYQVIRHEARLRGLRPLAKASETDLQRIYDIVGGNPLALKLIVGQTAFLPLSQVLSNLQEARGKSVTDLYNYIYWQAWNMLDEVSQQTLLIMPLTQEGTLNQLLSLCQLDVTDLHQALQQLATLSLVQVEGDLDERRYSIHRLTETFLLKEAIAWQSSV